MGQVFGMGLGLLVLIPLALLGIFLYSTRHSETTLHEGPLELTANSPTIFLLSTPLSRHHQVVIIKFTIDGGNDVEAMLTSRKTDFTVECVSTEDKTYATRLKNWGGGNYLMLIQDLPRWKKIEKLKLISSAPLTIKKIVWLDSWTK